jgi:hypothetical protein
MSLLLLLRTEISGGSGRGWRIGEACPERSRRGVAPKQVFLKRNSQCSAVVTKVRDREDALPRTARPAPYLLRAFFERGGFAAQVRQDFASEMQ